MNRESFSKSAVLSRLREQNLEFRELHLSETHSVIITAYGGRIFGPFQGDDGPSLFWLNDGFRDSSSFAALLEQGLPLGGERIWISPEIQYGVTNRNDFWGSLFVPESVDPGNYTLHVGGGEAVRLSQEMDLEAYNLGRGHKKLQLDRTVQPTGDPLRHLSDYEELRRDVDFAGYRHTLHLRDLNPNHIRSESWSLVQINPGGTILIPTLSRPEHRNYFNPAPSELVTIGEREFRAEITGQNQYKVGIKCTNTIGRIAYLLNLGGERYALIVRSFYNNPALPYTDEPPEEPREAGFSMHIYNDDGRFGGFGELENMGCTVGGSAGQTESRDLFELWVYYAGLSRLRGVARQLLGLELR